MPANETKGKKTAAKKATAQKATAKKATAKKATAKKAKGMKAKATDAMRARPGDVIVIDSPQVGSPPREGEVLKVIHGELSVSYRVKWSDGRETLLSPVAGAARIVRA